MAGTKEFGDAVLRCREHHGWTQEALGSKVRLSQPQVSRIEHGRADLDAELVDRFERALKVPAGVLSLFAFGCDEDGDACDAFEALLRLSWTSHRRLEAVASDMVLTHALAAGRSRR